MNLPNLFIVGSMKCGTSYLHALLRQHPDIFMCDPKEPGYFIDPAQEDPRKAAQRGFWNDRQLYLNLFAKGQDHKYLGEATTDYTKAPKKTDCAHRIHAFNPDAHIIYLMRDPVERTISHFWWDLRTGGETRDLVSAIKQEPFFRDVSYYAMQLNPYVKLFGKNRVMATTFEALKASPVATLQSLFRWLEVDDRFVPRDVDRPVNQAPETMRQLRRKGFLYRMRWSPLWEKVGPWCPTSVRRLARCAVERQVCRRDVALEPAVEFLRPIQREQTDELSELLGREFPEWTLLNGTHA